MIFIVQQGTSAVQQIDINRKKVNIAQSMTYILYPYDSQTLFI